MGYQEYAAGFGDIVALDEIGLLWFAAPVLTALGVYIRYLQVKSLLLTKYFLKKKYRLSFKYSMHTESKYSLNHTSFHSLSLWYRFLFHSIVNDLMILIFLRSWLYVN